MPEKVKELNMFNVWRTCNKIRAAIGRVYINIWDCFNPVDPQKHNMISEPDFLSILSGSLNRVIGLSNQEICELADYFRAQDGRIFYVQFCSIIDKDKPKFEKNFPWVSGEEWEDPLQANCLSISEERRLGIILSKIASLINRRRLVLRPYFQDYELIAKNCGVVTFAHFARVLHFLDITLASEEMHLLIKKFAKDSYTVNYLAFIKTVEEIQEFLKEHGAFDQGGDLLDNFPGRIITAKFPKLPRPEIGKIKTACVFPQMLHFLTLDTSTKRIRGVYELILRIQDHVLKNHIRVAMYFKHFDVFNVGRISENQFERGLDALRASALGKLYISKEELEILKAFYKDPNDMERICWRTFEDDVEQVFTIKHLQKHPECKVVPPMEVINLPRKGFQEWDCTEYDVDTEALTKLYKKTFNKVKHRVKERRFSLRKYFRDFDKSNRGHVTRAQLRQVLAIAAIPLTREEISSLEFMHNNDLGFHWLDFITKLEKVLGESDFGCDKEPTQKKTSTSIPSGHHVAAEELDVDLILSKIKAKVVSEGIKANQFMRKFDIINKKVVTRSEFHRGLDLLKCELTCTEVKTLSDYFADHKRPDHIDYWKFSEAVESAIAQEQLEKSPHACPVQHVPSGATPRSFLNFDERQVLMRTLNTLTSYADRNLEEVFKDFDKQVNCGAITRNELIRAFSVRKIMDVINANELEVLFKCFSVGHLKTEPKFHYRNFLNALYVLVANKTIVPL